jgi:hypothetical protein
MISLNNRWKVQSPFSGKPEMQPEFKIETMLLSKIYSSCTQKPTFSFGQNWTLSFGQSSKFSFALALKARHFLVVLQRTADPKETFMDPDGDSEGEENYGLEDFAEKEQSRDNFPSFGCIVEESIAGLDGDIIHTMTDNALVLVLARKSLTTMLPDGLCWTDRDGDLHVHFRNPFTKEGKGGTSMPWVHLSHGTSGKSSRLLGQMMYILKARLDEEAAAWPGQKSTAREMFVKRTYFYLKKRLQTVPRHCMHCDKEHGVTGVPMWRPTA